MTNHTYAPMGEDWRDPEEVAADEAALPLLTPGVRVRRRRTGHCFPLWEGVVLRVFTDATSGPWVEIKDTAGDVSAGRPSWWEVIDAKPT